MGWTAAQRQINWWFWAGAFAWGVGGLFVLSVLWGMAHDDRGVYGAIAMFGGTLSMLVGIIGKGVELGVRAANDE